MPASSRVAFLFVSLFLAAFLSACKIQVSVPQGGSVQSADYQVAAGETIVIDVEDTTFAQIFIAQPDSGYVFTGWQGTPGYLCGDSKAPCVLTTAPLQGPFWEAIFAGDALYFLTPMFECSAGEGACDGTTVAGTVYGAAGPLATVTASVAGTSTTATADEAGHFELVLPNVPEDALVTLTAAGMDSAGNPVELVSLPGPVSALDGDTRISVLTSAAYVLLMQANGGQAPATVEELLVAERAMVPDDLLNIANGLYVQVEQIGGGVPAGSASLVDWIAALWATDGLFPYLDQVAADNSIDTEAFYFSVLDGEGGDVVDGFVAADLTDTWIADPDITTPGFLTEVGDIVEFDAGGAGLFANGIIPGRADGVGQEDGFTWSLENGGLDLDADTLLGGSVSFSIIDTFVEQASQFPGWITPEEEQRILDLLTTEDGFRISLQVETISGLSSQSYTSVLYKGLGTYVVTKQEVLTQQFDDFVVPSGETISLPDRSFSGMPFLSSVFVSPADSGLAFESTCIEGTLLCVEGLWGGASLYSVTDPSSPIGASIGDLPGDTFSFLLPESLYADIFQVGVDGSLATLIGQRSGNWTVENGQWIVNYADGRQQILTPLFVLENDAGIEVGVKEQLIDGGTVQSTYSRYVKVAQGVVNNPPLAAANLANAQGTYWNNSFVFRLGGAFASDGLIKRGSAFGISLTAEGSGFQETDSEAGTLTLWAGDWSTNGEYLAFERDDLFGEVRTRYWVPIQRFDLIDERAFYALEYELAEFTDFAFMRIAPRLRLVRETERRDDYSEYRDISGSSIANPFTP